MCDSRTGRPTRLSHDLLVLGCYRSCRPCSRHHVFRGKDDRFWDATEAVVLAPGIMCFEAGMEYAHGGLTVQEALIPSLMVSAKHAGIAKAVLLKDLKWSGLRLNVVLEGAQGLIVDVRGKVADADSSFAASQVSASGNGQKTSLLVEDDSTVGSKAFLVVVDEDGQVVFKHPIVIGES